MGLLRDVPTKLNDAQRNKVQNNSLIIRGPFGSRNWAVTSFIKLFLVQLPFSTQNHAVYEMRGNEAQILETA
jgi:hypothetical protein